MSIIFKFLKKFINFIITPPRIFENIQLNQQFQFFKGYENTEHFLNRRRRRCRPVDYSPRNKRLKWNFVQENIDLSSDTSNILTGQKSQIKIPSCTQASITTGISNSKLSGPGEKMTLSLASSAMVFPQKSTKTNNSFAIQNEGKPSAHTVTETLANCPTIEKGNQSTF